MKRSIDKTERRKLYETPTMRVVHLETNGQLLQASQLPSSPIPIPFSPIPGIPD